MFHFTAASHVDSSLESRTRTATRFRYGARSAAGSCFSDRRLKNFVSRNTFSHASNYQCSSARRQDPRARVYRREDLLPGTVIRAYMYEEALRGGRVAGKNSLFQIDQGDPLCVKYRYMIVVAVYSSSYICIPLLTHNGDGLSKKSDLGEYVSIRDHRLCADNYIAQSPHEPLVTAFMESTYPLHERTTAWLTYPVSRMYSLPVVIEGRLAPDSTKQLLQLFNGSAPSVEVVATGACQQDDLLDKARHEARESKENTLVPEFNGENHVSVGNKRSWADMAHC